jgi:hypothetical protein
VSEEFPFSTLPGEHRLRPEVEIPEQQGLYGGRRGLTHAVIEASDAGYTADVVGRTLETAHYVQPVTLDWSSVAVQRMFVWTRFKDTPRDIVAGVEFVHPDPGLAEGLLNPNVWYAERVDTFDGKLRGCGIASMLYGHAAVFGYRITRSPVRMGDGGSSTPADRLWGRLHPGYDEAEDSGELPTDVSAFDKDTLNGLVAKFGPNSAGALFDLLDPMDNTKWGFRHWPSGDTGR